MLATMNTIHDCPSLIRYPRGAGEGVEMPSELVPLPVGKAEKLADGSDVCLLALGNMNGYAARVRELLEAQGVSCAHVNARFVCPLDTGCILQEAAATRLLVTLEDHVIAGGFGSAVMEMLNEHHCSTPVLRLGWPNQFIEHGTEAILREKYGLTPQAMAESVLKRLQS
jgi:1-deoxy-D-xylulose-5-phosphate synthase